jgi:hypothetical protein
MWQKKKLSTASDDHALIRESAVLDMVPFGRSELRRQVKDGRFKPPIRIKTSGGKTILAWQLGEIRQYNLNLIRQRDLQIAAEKARASESDAAPDVGVQHNQKGAQQDVAESDEATPGG